MGLTLTTAAAKAAVTRDKIRTHLRVTATEDDDLIDTLVAAATARAELVTNRQLITATYTLTLDKFPTVIHLPRAPLQSVTHVKYYDTAGVQQTWSSAEYAVDTDTHPGRLAPAYGYTWPTHRQMMNAIEVEYIAGYGDDPGDVPEGLRVAVKMLAGHWYENREFAAEATLREVPGAVNALLWQHRIFGTT